MIELLRCLGQRASFLVVLLLCMTCTTVQAKQKQPIILDADTGNEVDDLFALSIALIEPSWDVLALNATHWQTSLWAEPQTMENSHRLNQVLLGHLGLSVKTRRGGEARMYDWGDQARHSAAAYEIIKQAKLMPAGEKLTVVALGALTNVSSALIIAPEIAPRIKLYWLGTTYDFQEGVLSQTDFNCVMDIQALAILLRSQVELHVMPLNVAAHMEFEYAETERLLRGRHPLADLLCDRWFNHLDGLRKKRVLWDIALIQAMLHPEWATQTTITTSKDNGSRQISYYSEIEAEKMKQAFFDNLLAFFAKEMQAVKKNAVDLDEEN